MKSPANFCNHAITVDDWYAVLRSKDLRKGTSRSIRIANHSLIIRRFRDGKVVALERYCPHMGSDLMLGKEVDNRLQCAFHGLEFTSEGKCAQTCAKTEKYNLRTFRTVEKYGFIFLYTGEDEPQTRLPELSLTNGPTFLSPTRRINCHHHMILCNGLDKPHTKFVHTWESLAYNVRAEGTKVVATLKGEYTAWWMKLLNNTHQKPIEFTFTTYGSSMAVADVQWSATRLVILFVSYGDGKVSYANTGLYLSTYNPIRWLRGAIVTFAILWQDTKILNNLQIRQNFTQEDEGVTLYRDVINEMTAS
jgi:phenylpropionate dioxygenase-like ring-hydroxylating dioxygenase large terminal subunit